MSRFLNAEYLYGILGVMALVSWFYYALTRTSPLRKFFSERMYKVLTQSVSMIKKKMKLLLQGLVLTLFLISLARFQLGQGKQNIQSEGIEIILAIDISNSMMAEDIRPNRLDQVKKEMTKLVGMLAGNKVGIIAFAGTASLISPLTTDPSALEMYIDSLSPDIVSEQGTNFDNVFKAAESSFARGTSDTSGETITQALIVASDGEDQESRYEESAKKLKEKGIHIFGLAYGTEKGGLIPERDERGELRGYKKDESGQSVLSTVKGDALKKIASIGDGSFYYASFGGSHIQNLVDDLAKLEKTKFETSESIEYQELFQIFLFLALLMALIETVLSEKKRAAKVWKGRFSEGEL